VTVPPRSLEEKLCDPANYLSQAGEMVDRVLAGGGSDELGAARRVAPHVNPDSRRCRQSGDNQRIKSVRAPRTTQEGLSRAASGRRLWRSATLNGRAGPAVRCHALTAGGTISALTPTENSVSVRRMRSPADPYWIAKEAVQLTVPKGASSGHD
jgi:hypothetical protein